MSLSAGLELTWRCSDRLLRTDQQHLSNSGRAQSVLTTTWGAIILPMTITCEAMGYTCGYEITGKSMDQLISGVKHHAGEFHGYTDEEINDPEKLEAWKGSIRQTSRPESVRVPRDESDRAVTPH